MGLFLRRRKRRKSCVVPFRFASLTHRVQNLLSPYLNVRSSPLTQKILILTSLAILKLSSNQICSADTVSEVFEVVHGATERMWNGEKLIEVSAVPDFAVILSLCVRGEDSEY